MTMSVWRDCDERARASVCVYLSSTGDVWRRYVIVCVCGADVNTAEGAQRASAATGLIDHHQVLVLVM